MIFELRCHCWKNKNVSFWFKFEYICKQFKNLINSYEKFTLCLYKGIWSQLITMVSLKWIRTAFIWNNQNSFLNVAFWRMNNGSHNYSRLIKTVSESSCASLICDASHKRDAQNSICHVLIIILVILFRWWLLLCIHMDRLVLRVMPAKDMF